MVYGEGSQNRTGSRLSLSIENLKTISSQDPTAEKPTQGHRLQSFIMTGEKSSVLHQKKKKLKSTGAGDTKLPSFCKPEDVVGVGGR